MDLHLHRWLPTDGPGVLPLDGWRLGEGGPRPRPRPQVLQGIQQHQSGTRCTLNGGPGSILEGTERWDKFSPYQPWFSVCLGLVVEQFAKDFWVISSVEKKFGEGLTCNSSPTKSSHGEIQISDSANPGIGQIQEVRLAEDFLSF